MYSSLLPIDRLLRNVLRVALPVSVILTIYLYLYPVFLTCAFPLPSTTGTPNDGLPAYLETLKLHLPWADGSRTHVNSTVASTRLAPFRLLALGDPQIEGDTSIPNAYSDSSFPHIYKFAAHLGFRNVAGRDHSSFRQHYKQALHDLVDFYFDDIPNTVESIRKRIDLFGNDFYLAHMYRTVNWWTLPTHTTVLGDLVGSQWIEDEEFERRGWRFWNRVMRGRERVPDEAAAWPEEEYELAGFLGTVVQNETWVRRIINVAGNHDIGYAGDLNMERMERFERVFGKANYELRFEMPASVLSAAAASTIPDENAAAPEEGKHLGRLVPELRIVVLNDMNLDTPATSSELQDQTYAFINSVINTATAVEYKGFFTVVLTHVPLHKPEGVCVDAPFFAFHDHDDSLKEQNLLSADASRGFVEGIFGLNGDSTAPGNGQGRRGVILNGHDHEGCDTYHFINQSHGQSVADREWQAKRWVEAKDEGVVERSDMPGVREITVRSMMGDFGGNAGLLSAWFDEDSWEWKFDYTTCALGTQHLWWAVHIMDFIVVVLCCVYGVMKAVAAIVPRARGDKPTVVAAGLKGLAKST